LLSPCAYKRNICLSLLMFIVLLAIIPLFYYNLTARIITYFSTWEKLYLGGQLARHFQK
jgi:hypothetical protein